MLGVVGQQCCVRLNASLYSIFTPHLKGLISQQEDTFSAVCAFVFRLGASRKIPSQSLQLSAQVRCGHIIALQRAAK